MKRDLTSTIYRLLTGVGKSTAVLTFCKEKDRDVGAMHPAEIEGIREVWEKTLKLPDPKDAIDIIKNSHAVTLLWREGSRVH